MDPSMEKVRQERKQLLYLIEKEITELSLLGPSFHSQVGKSSTSCTTSCANNIILMLVILMALFSYTDPRCTDQ